MKEVRAKEVVVFDSRKEPIILFGCMASSESSALEASDEHAKYAQNVGEMLKKTQNAKNIQNIIRTGLQLVEVRSLTSVHLLEARSI